MKTVSSRVLCGLLAVAVVAVLCSGVAHAAPPPWKVVVYPKAIPVLPHKVYVPYTPPVVYQPVLRNPTPTVYMANPILVSQGIAVVNPADSGVTLRFRVDGVAHQLEAGTRQELEHSRVRIIEFDRGGSFGLARYRLTEGDYNFRLTDQGWTLQRKPYSLPSLVME
jgi:hypothetical protein